MQPHLIVYLPLTSFILESPCAWLHILLALSFMQPLLYWPVSCRLAQFHEVQPDSISSKPALNTSYYLATVHIPGSVRGRNDCETILDLMNKCSIHVFPGQIVWRTISESSLENLSGLMISWLSLPCFISQPSLSSLESYSWINYLYAVLCLSLFSENSG